MNEILSGNVKRNFYLVVHSSGLNNNSLPLFPKSLQPLLLITFSSASPDRNFLAPALRSSQLTFRANPFSSRLRVPPNLSRRRSKQNQWNRILSIDSKLPIGILKDVMQLTIEACKAATNYIRK
ncbi:hypothetical protein HN873_066559, partial [Arachis hypogaea]